MEHKISMMLLLITGAMMLGRSTGESSPPAPPFDHTCISEMTVCKGTNTSTPSPACCTTLNNVYYTEFECLCLSVYTNQLGFTNTQINDLLIGCNITSDLITFLCNETAPIPAPSLDSPPLTPGNFPFPPPIGLLSPPPPLNKASVLCTAKWIRLSGLASLFLFSFFIWH